MARSPPAESSRRRHPRSTETHPLENGHHHQHQTQPLGDRDQPTGQPRRLAIRRRHGRQAERLLSTSPGDDTDNTLQDESAESTIQGWAEEGTLLQVQAQALLDNGVNFQVVYPQGMAESDFASSTTLNAENDSLNSDYSRHDSNDHIMQRWTQQTRGDEPWAFRDGSAPAVEHQSPYPYEPSAGYLATPRTLTISHEDLMGLADVAHEYHYQGWAQSDHNGIYGLIDDEPAGDFRAPHD